MADTKRAAAHRGPGPERGVAAYRRTPEREQTILIGWPSDIGGRQHDNTALSVIRRDQVAGSDSAFFVAVQQQSCSSQEIQPSTWPMTGSRMNCRVTTVEGLPGSTGLNSS